MIAGSVKSDVIVFLTGRSVTANLHCDLRLHYWTLIVASVCLIEGHECGRARSCGCVCTCVMTIALPPPIDPLPPSRFSAHLPPRVRSYILT